MNHTAVSRSYMSVPLGLLFAILFVSILSLSACTEALPATLPAPGESASRPTSRPYIFGSVLPLTGTNAFYGEFSKTGIELAVQDINKAGGINERLVTIIFEDSAGDKSRATTAAKKLVDVDGVDALFTVTTPMAGSVAPVAEEARVPLIYASATNAFAINKTYVFKDYPDAADGCEILYRQARRDGHASITLFGTDAEFTHYCKKGANRVGALQTFEVYAPGETDYKTQYTKIKNAGSTALILSQFAPDCPNSFKQLRELDLHPQLYVAFQSFACGSAENTDKNQDLLANAFGVDVGIDEANPKVTAFLALLKNQGLSTNHLIGSAILYDDVQLAAAAFKGCLDSRCVADHIRTTQGFKGLTGTLSFNGKQTVDREIILTHQDKGAWRKAQ